MTGRALPPSSAFADDDGSADPRLAAALAGLAERPADLAPVVAALATARVLVPVVARLEASGVTDSGLHVDKEASAAVVALRAPDGREALPVFTSVDAVARWRGDARPMPAEGPRAAHAALDEGWELLVVDPAGPVTAVVPRPAVHALATGRTWRPAVVDGEVVPEVRAAVSGAVDGVPHVVRAEAEPGRRAEVAVVLALEPGLDRGALDAVLGRASRALAADEVVAREVDTIEMRVVAAR